MWNCADLPETQRPTCWLDLGQLDPGRWQRPKHKYLFLFWRRKKKTDWILYLQPVCDNKLMNFVSGSAISRAPRWHEITGEAGAAAISSSSSCLLLAALLKEVGGLKGGKGGRQDGICCRLTRITVSTCSQTLRFVSSAHERDRQHVWSLASVTVRRTAFFLLVSSLWWSV